MVSGQAARPNGRTSRRAEGRAAGVVLPVIANVALLWLAAVAGLYLWILLTVAVMRPRRMQPMPDETSKPVAAPLAGVSLDRWLMIIAWAITAILALRSGQPIPQPPAADSKPVVLVLNATPATMSVAAHP